MFQVINKILIISLIITQTYSQFVKITYYEEKPGSCPPPLPTENCSQACFVDENCHGIEKCCSTICGGSTCSKPITTEESHSEKLGSCPKTPTGRRLCSPTCATDNNCRGSKLCCKNRCGVLTCQLPQVEPKKIDKTVESTTKAPINENVDKKINKIPTDDFGFNPNNPFLFPKN